MKLCRDCKHFVAEDETCESPRNGGIDRVTGKRKPNFRFCETQRNGEGWLMSIFIGTCGEPGRWFEPKGDALTPTRRDPPPMPTCKPVRAPCIACYGGQLPCVCRHVTPATDWDVALAAEKRKEKGVDYRFIGLMGDSEY